MEIKSKEELWERAEEVLAQYKNADKVFATTDGNVFLDENRAQLHAGKGRVVTFERQVFSDSKKTEDADRMTAKETVKAIAESESIGDLEKFVNDDRKTVKEAYQKKLEEFNTEA